MKISLYQIITFSLLFSTLTAAEKKICNKSLFQEDRHQEDSYKILHDTKNFRWLVDGVIAGMQQPSNSTDEENKLVDEEDVLAHLNRVGIGTIITLNEYEWNSELLYQKAIINEKYSIEEKGLTLDNIQNVLTAILTKTAYLNSSDCLGKGLVIHCTHGDQRTGILLGLWLLIHHPELENFLNNPNDSDLKDNIKKTVIERITKDLGKAKGVALKTLLHKILSDTSHQDHDKATATIASLKSFMLLRNTTLTTAPNSSDNLAILDETSNSSAKLNTTQEIKTNLENLTLKKRSSFLTSNRVSRVSPASIYTIDDNKNPTPKRNCYAFILNFFSHLNLNCCRDRLQTNSENGLRDSVCGQHVQLHS